MSTQKEIKFRDRLGDLVGVQNGILFIVRTEPGVIAGTPAHWVTAVPKDGRPIISTLGHQCFNLAEAKEFCHQIAAGEIDLKELQAQYDAEDEASIRNAEGSLSKRVVLFLARLAAEGLSYRRLLELEKLHAALGEGGHAVLLAMEHEDGKHDVLARV